MRASPREATFAPAIEPFQAMWGARAAQTLRQSCSEMASTSSGELFIGRILQKTYISVTEEGTRAAAASAVLMADGCCIQETKNVVLDRPFVYCIVDMETSLPVFIGTVETLEN